MNRCLKFWPASLLLCLLSLADIGSAQDTVPKGPKGGPMQLSADVTAGRASVDSKWLNYEEVGGLAIAEGDIVLGTLAEMRGAPAKKNGLRSSVVVRGGQFRWPGGLVPYVIDESGSRNPSMALVARQAIRHWEEKTSYRFVERTTQRNYIKFYAQDSGC
ncbi:MAG TPA: M12 family metallopeptidase, partial [Bryobacteraceae bacterium]|nr:M12 family metallopeptidase [Bryobacteraceae bacterium]